MHATVEYVRRLDYERLVTGRPSQPISSRSSWRYRECQKFGQFGELRKTNEPQKFSNSLLPRGAPRNQNFEASTQMTSLTSSIWNLLGIMRTIGLSNHLNSVIIFRMNH
jgi:hypothetical protein